MQRVEAWKRGKHGQQRSDSSAQEEEVGTATASARSHTAQKGQKSVEAQDNVLGTQSKLPCLNGGGSARHVIPGKGVVILKQRPASATWLCNGAWQPAEAEA